VDRYALAGLCLVAAAVIVAFLKSARRSGSKGDSVPQSVLNRIRAEYPFDASR
jgi:hypothetical protein